VGDAEPAPELIADVLGEDASGVGIYGDSSYGTADMVELIEEAGADANVKVQPPSPAKKGLLAQDAFTIDTKQETVSCPAGQLVQLRRRDDGSRVAAFGRACQSCALRERCTQSKDGRLVYVHPKYETLHRSRERQRDPEWKMHYRATRPKVERKIAHLMRRKHGGRRARVRGRLRIAHDFALLAAAVNLARLAKLHTTAAPA
jgi:hypothetical protein